MRGVGVEGEQKPDVASWTDRRTLSSRLRNLAQGAGQDVRFAARLLAKDRGFTFVAVLALALGIGVNTTMFTAVNAICLRGLPIDEPERVMSIRMRDARELSRDLSYRDFDEIRRELRAFDSVAAAATVTTAVREEDEDAGGGQAGGQRDVGAASGGGSANGTAPDRVIASYVSAGAFRAIGETPRIGRDFRDDDDRVEAPAVVIIGSGLWTSRYGSDPSIVGRTILVGSRPATVIGVMPDRFKFPNNADLWLPLASMPGLRDQPRDARTLTVFGRLRDGVTAGHARDEVASTIARLAREFPETNAGMRALVEPINDRFNSPITQPAWIAFISVGIFLVLISCANVANLLLMRSARRGRELAVRAALGATRARMVRQLLVESALLATLGGVFGLGVAVIGNRLFAAAIPEGGLPYWIELTIDGRVLAVLTAACLGTVMLFGLAPSLTVSKTDVRTVLSEAGRSVSGGIRARRWTAVFLTAEFALTTILLCGLVGNVYAAIEGERASRTFDTSNLLTMWVTPAPQRYPGDAERLAFYQRVDERLRAIPAIAGVTLAGALPLSGAAPRQLEIDGRSSASGAGATKPTVFTTTVGAGYFETLGRPVLRGRSFTWRDGTPGNAHVIVNQRFVDVFLRDGDPIGRRIRLTSDQRPTGPTTAPRAPGAGTSASSAASADSAPWLTIVGIAPVLRQRLAVAPDPIVYLPLGAAPPSSAAIVVRSTTSPEALAPLLRGEVRALDPDLPVYRVRTMAQVIDEAGWNPRLSGNLLMTIALIAFGLAAVGLYAVTAHAVAQRTHEIGIRVALGAETRQVAWLVLRRALRQLAVGLAAGLVCTYAFDRAFSAPSDPNSFMNPAVIGPAMTLLIVMTLAASLAPIVRATRLDPVIALRRD
jgi:predicted permease